MTSTEATTSRAGVKRYDDEDDETQVERAQFIAVFRRNGTAEDHEFSAAPQIDYKALIGFASDRMSVAAKTMERTIRQSLVDDDGLSVHHVPGEDDDVPKFEDGSSRRRWTHLMDDDDEVTISERVIMAMFKDLVKEASKARPTKR